MRSALAAAAVSGLLLSSTAVTAGGPASYHLTITDITNFTPILLASHRKGVSVFEPGSPARYELTAIAESGDIAPLTSVFQGNPRVADAQD